MKKIVQKVNKKRSSESHFVSELKWRSKSSLFMSKKKKKTCNDNWSSNAGVAVWFWSGTYSYSLAVVNVRLARGHPAVVRAHLWDVLLQCPRQSWVFPLSMWDKRKQLTECICFKKLGINFINILCSPFSPKPKCNLWKAARALLMKLSIFSYFKNFKFQYREKRLSDERELMEQRVSSLAEELHQTHEELLSVR